MNNNDKAMTALNDTTRALLEATNRRLAAAAANPIIMNDRPADTSRNGRRNPGSRTVRFIR
ncbi:MAG: hypothetical protein LC687_00020 [Actinobacteria bacterium]|nr:hypothetical protein [Actinomycetota bacterium]